MASAGTLPGFRDFYPPELAERAYIFARWREVVRRYGFLEYDGPPLEPLELYTKKSGEEIVTQLFNFVDKGGRDVSLRPEMTPTFARMVGAKANALRKPVRWFSLPQLFRYEKAQKGRLREHFQLNVDIVGEADVTADAELVACAIDLMKAFGLGPADVRVRVSDRRVLGAWLSALGIAEASHSAVFVVIDKIERAPVEVSRAKLAAAGVPEAAIGRVLAVATTTFEEVAQALAGTAAAEHTDNFARFREYVATLTGDGAAWLHFDLSIVRGLAYYTGIVFELFDATGEFRAICGGGRYDQLLGALGGADLPALGFGMGDVVLGELLRARGLMRTEGDGLDFWVAATSGDAAATAEVMRLAGDLRRRGHRVEYALRPQTASKQLKAAAAAGARTIVILPPTPGAGEAPATEVTLRDIAGGTERRVTLATWLAQSDVNG